MAAEYRLVMVRPEYEDGSPRERIYSKRDLAHAETSLAEWQMASDLYRQVGLEAWPGHIETRDVTPWVRVAAAPLVGVDWGSR